MEHLFTDQVHRLPDTGEEEVVVDMQLQDRVELDALEENQGVYWVVVLEAREIVSLT